MEFRKLFLILFLLLTTIPTSVLHAQSANTGFVQGNIWYSKDPFEEGDKVKIYTLIFNPDTRELSGTVVFFDNKVFLGKKAFNVPARGVKDVSIDWTVSAGAHSIFGKIEDSKFLLAGGKVEDVYLLENKTQESSRTVDKKIVIKTDKSDTPSIPTLDTVKNLEKSITDHIPDSISASAVSATNIVDKLRTDVGSLSQNKKSEVQNQIKNLNNVKNSPNSKTGEIGKFLKPFKYIELFFLAILSFIFNNKIVFYPVLFFFLFLILRYFWRLIFS